jgi:two-component system, NtrC family, response regulator AtoC
MATQAHRCEADGALHGTSENMEEVRDLIRRVADTDVTILIRGESGTGKNLVARAIHEASPRRERPFVKVNCAALPSELLESELFGFERGAFTGAIQRKPGKFEFADHGTMFLDEISEMHLALQSKLLQVLQDGEFSRLGGRDDMHVDVRVVSATNRDLESAVANGEFREDLYFRLNVVSITSAVANGEFREDLYFRLNVVSITLPPLRQRRSEIMEFARIFIERSCRHYNKPPVTIGDETRRLMENYDWPGNVRELENLIKRATILGSGESLKRDLEEAQARRHARPGAIPLLQSPAPMPPPVSSIAGGSAVSPAAPPGTPPAMAAAPSGAVSLKEIGRQAARGAERELISRTLQQTRWNRREAAEILGISYKALLYKIKEAQLDKAS